MTASASAVPDTYRWIDAQGGGVVADQPAREVNQDRREGRQPWPLRHLPDGRGRGATTDVPGNPVADRPVAGAARASMRSAGIRCDKRRQQKCASKQAKLRVSAPRRIQLIGSTLAANAVRDLPLPATGEGAILGPTTTPNPGNVG